MDAIVGLYMYVDITAGFDKKHLVIQVTEENNGLAVTSVL